MQAIIERCCGLDVHQDTIVACLLVGAPGAQPNKEALTFRTVTRDLEALRDWLREAGATHVGMESTGVYWRPVYAVLEGSFELIVGNARHIRNVPGRKTDVKDSEWIADLVRHGLIAKSFVPPRPLQEPRELLRYRRKLTESQTAERNRLLKLLKDRQHQAGERCFRRFRRVRPRDAPGADRRRGLPRGDGRSRQRPAAPQARRPDPRARRAPR
jgi:transposase